MSAWTCRPSTWRDGIGADLPGGDVLFSTRRGGGIRGPVRLGSNLGRLTDEPGRASVRRNRARLAARPRRASSFALRAPGPRATVRRAIALPAGRAEGGRAGDRAGGRAALVFTADCMP